MTALDSGRADLAGTRLVEIPETEYAALQRDSAILAALHAGGVDNWEWYGDSLRDAGLCEEDEEEDE
jgi:hypothetical protein